jgi:hypothetical protein
MSDLIQSLWVGNRLSMMERLSIQSFLQHGHEYHLYGYEPIVNAPEGAMLRDAAEILPAAAIFQYTAHASYAGFSNYFRYKLLLEWGDWWVDTDVVCLRRFEFATPHVFSAEAANTGPVPASAVIRSPAGSPAMRHAWEVCQSRRPETLQWGETGPRLVAEAIKACGLEACVQPPEVFCPVACKHWRMLLEEEAPLPSFNKSSAIHLWNELWRRNDCAKDAAFPPGSLYEQLKRRYPPAQAPSLPVPTAA